MKIYEVGGAVRDALLETKAKDRNNWKRIRWFSSRVWIFTTNRL